MDLSVPGWIGAFAGTIVAVALCAPLNRAVDRRMRMRLGANALDRRGELEDRLSLVRRVILGCAIAILSTLGFWAGTVFGSMRG